MRNPIKVLLVDDEKGIRFLLSEALLHKGFEVSLARDGQESLEKLENNHFGIEKFLNVVIAATARNTDGAVQSQFTAKPYI